MVADNGDGHDPRARFEGFHSDADDTPLGTVANSGDGHGPRARFEGFHSYADGTPLGTVANSGDGHGPRARFEGFHSYADGTPLEDVDDSAYASAEADRPTEDVPRRRPGWPPGSFVAAAGVALAVAGGFWLGRVLPDPGAERAAEAVTAAPTAPTAQMDVEVAQVAPPAPPPVTGGRLEVLPPDVAAPAHDISPPTGRAADTATAAPGNLPPMTSASAPPETLTIPPPPRVEPQRVDPPRIAPPAPVPRELADGQPRTSYSCRDAPTRARAMVCADPRLAALDQQMRRAYDAALAAGIPEAELRADQADWLDIREDAARYSRNAVSQIYRQRIEELRTMLEN